MFCLIGSTCLTLAVSLSCYTVWMKAKRARLQDSSYNISVLIQTGPEKEALKTAYLAELLGLSVDKNVNLAVFDLDVAKQRLNASPLISSAEVRKIFPNILYIDYSVRKPVSWLGDYQNIALDQEGYLFPVYPFFSPKELPVIYLGLPPFGADQDSLGRKGGLWQTPLQNRYLYLAFEILQFLEGSLWKEGFRIQRIDVSNAFAPSLGQREIVLFTEEELSVVREGKSLRFLFPKILRLSPKEYAQQMNNFFALQKNMKEDYLKQLSSADELPSFERFAPRIIDLRIPHLAFVENQS